MNPPRLAVGCTAPSLSLRNRSPQRIGTSLPRRAHRGLGAPDWQRLPSSFRVLSSSCLKHAQRKPYNAIQLVRSA